MVIRISTMKLKYLRAFNILENKSRVSPIRMPSLSHCRNPPPQIQEKVADAEDDTAGHLPLNDFPHNLPTKQRSPRSRSRSQIIYQRPQQPRCREIRIVLDDDAFRDGDGGQKEQEMETKDADA